MSKYERRAERNAHEELVAFMQLQRNRIRARLGLQQRRYQRRIADLALGSSPMIEQRGGPQAWHRNGHVDGLEDV